MLGEAASLKPKWGSEFGHLEMTTLTAPNVYYALIPCQPLSLTHVALGPCHSPVGLVALLSPPFPGKEVKSQGEEYGIVIPSQFNPRMTKERWQRRMET